MMYSIVHTEQGPVIFEIKGKIMGGEKTDMFQLAIHQEIANNQKWFIIDLGGVDWMSMMGVGMLISALTTVKNADGRLILCHIESLESCPTITPLISIFEHYENAEKAIASFSA